MKTFYLKIWNSNEVINKGDFRTLIDAIGYFSIIKNLSEEKLLEIFKVTDK